MDCNKAMTQITNYVLNQLFGEGTLEEGIEEAINHVAKCQHCIKELHAMGSLLTGKKSNLKENWEKLFVSNCEEFSEIVPQYIEDELNGADVKSQYFLLCHHLQNCFSCRKEYIDLKEMLQLKQEVAVLESEKEAPPIWETVKEDIRRLSAKLKITVIQGVVAFQDLPASIENFLVPDVIPIYREKFKVVSNKSIAGYQTLMLPDKKHNTQITAKIRVHSDGNINLLIQVNNIKTNAPLIEAKVTLYNNQNKILEKSSTDQLGIVEFEDLIPDNYLTRIQYKKITWEIRINFLQT